MWANQHCAKKSRPLSLEEIRSQYVGDLIESMRETMHDAPGVGLAAPQIGVPLQLVVIEDPQEAVQKLSPEQNAERERRPVPFQVLINPTLIILDHIAGGVFRRMFKSGVPTPRSPPRAAKVHVECLDEHADPIIIDATGWYARILQHEIDHLDGVLYIDRMNARSFATMDNHMRIWKDKTIEEVKQSLSRETG